MRISSQAACATALVALALTSLGLHRQPLLWSFQRDPISLFELADAAEFLNAAPHGTRTTLPPFDAQEQRKFCDYADIHSLEHETDPFIRGLKLDGCVKLQRYGYDDAAILLRQSSRYPWWQPFFDINLARNRHAGLTDYFWLDFALGKELAYRGDIRDEVRSGKLSRTALQGALSLHSAGLILHPAKIRTYFSDVYYTAHGRE